jgi:hypothetical protein
MWSHSTVRRVSFWATSFALRVAARVARHLNQFPNLVLIPLEFDRFHFEVPLPLPRRPHFRDYCCLCSSDNLLLPVPLTAIAQHGPTAD